MRVYKGIVYYIGLEPRSEKEGMNGDFYTVTVPEFNTVKFILKKNPATKKDISQVQLTYFAENIIKNILEDKK